MSSWRWLTLACVLSGNCGAEIVIQDHYAYFSIPAPAHCGYSCIAALEDDFARSKESIRGGHDWTKPLALGEVANLIGTCYLACEARMAKAHDIKSDLGALLEAGFHVVLHAKVGARIDGHFVHCVKRGGEIVIRDDKMNKAVPAGEFLTELEAKGVHPSGDFILVASSGSPLWNVIELEGSGGESNSSSPKERQETKSEDLAAKRFDYKVSTPVNGIFHVSLSVLKGGEGKYRDFTVTEAQGNCTCVRNVKLSSGAQGVKEVATIDFDIDSSAMPTNARGADLAMAMRSGDEEWAEKCSVLLPDSYVKFRRPSWWKIDHGRLNLYFPKDVAWRGCIVEGSRGLVPCETEIVRIPATGKSYVRWSMDLVDAGSLASLRWFSEETGWVRFPY